MRVLIIEDEEIAAEKLQVLIKKFDPTIEIMATIDSVKEAVQFLSQESTPDLIFLDIHLSDGISFEIFSKIKIKIPIIFTTAYNDYAIKAFELNSIDYLLKPIRSEDISRSLEKFKSMHQNFASHSEAIDFGALIEAITSQNKTYKERFLVKLGQKISSIPVEEIAYFYAEEKLVFLVTADNRRIPVDYSLDQLVDLLDPAQFFKANRQFVVKINAIETMYPYSNSRLKVTLKPTESKELIISNERVAIFKKWLDR